MTSCPPPARKTGARLWHRALLAILVLTLAVREASTDAGPVAAIVDE